MACRLRQEQVDQGTGCFENVVNNLTCIADQMQLKRAVASRISITGLIRSFFHMDISPCDETLLFSLHQNAIWKRIGKIDLAQTRDRLHCPFIGQRLDCGVKWPVRYFTTAVCLSYVETDHQFYRSATRYPVRLVFCQKSCHRMWTAVISPRAGNRYHDAFPSLFVSLIDPVQLLITYIGRC